MKKISINDLTYLALGSAVLGSGGGGDPTYNLWITQQLVKKKGSINLISLDDLNDNDLIVPVAFMGAPLVAIEKFSNNKEFEKIFKMIEKYFNKKPTALLPAEIGGSNAFTPLAISKQFNIPVLDGDLIGRAFPELHMSSPNLFNINASPGFLADDLGNATMVIANDNKIMENVARNITISYGSNAAVAIYIMNFAQAKKTIVSKSLSYAVNIGKIIYNAQKTKTDPIKVLTKFTKAKNFGSVIVKDIIQKIDSGFLKGKIILQQNDLTYEILFQNESLVLKKNNKIIVTTPDIITLVESNTGLAVGIEQIKYNMRLNILVLPAPKIWTTKKGLSLVGPRAFGYDFDYKKTGCII